MLIPLLEIAPINKVPWVNKTVGVDVIAVLGTDVSTALKYPTGTFKSFTEPPAPPSTVTIGLDSKSVDAS
jgi:hypothetical protein